MTEQMHVRVVMISGADHTIDLGAIVALPPSDDLVDVLPNLRKLPVVTTTRGAVLDPQRIESVQVDPEWQRRQEQRRELSEALQSFIVEVQNGPEHRPLIRVVDGNGNEMTDWYGSEPHHSAAGHRRDAFAMPYRGLRRASRGDMNRGVDLLLAAGRQVLDEWEGVTPPVQMFGSVLMNEHPADFSRLLDGHL